MGIKFRKDEPNEILETISETQLTQLQALAEMQEQLSEYTLTTCNALAEIYETVGVTA